METTTISPNDLTKLKFGRRVWLTQIIFDNFLGCIHFGELFVVPVADEQFATQRDLNQSTLADDPCVSVGRKEERISK